MENSNIDIFNRFLKNEMSEMEKSEFNSRLGNDDQLKNEFKEFTLIQAAIRKNALKNRLDGLKKQINSNNTSGKSEKNNYVIYILISLILSAFLGFFLYLKFETKQIEKIQKPIIDTIYEKKTIIPDSVKRNSEPIAANEEKFNKQDIALRKKKEPPVSKTKKSWLSYYAKPTYIAAILRDNRLPNDQIVKKSYELFDKGLYQDVVAIVEKNQNIEQLEYLKAHCLLLMNRTKEAAKIFRNFAEDDFSDYQVDSQWFLVLTLYNDLPDSKNEINSNLEKILKSENEKYKKEASKIMKELEN